LVGAAIRVPRTKLPFRQRLPLVPAIRPIRSDSAAIPDFVEECLRLEGPIKSTFRLALRDTTISGVDVPAGSVVMGLIGAANRDPRVFDDPDRFDPKHRGASQLLQRAPHIRVLHPALPQQLLAMVLRVSRAVILA
jgi:cytochrome P450